MDKKEIEDKLKSIWEEEPVRQPIEKKLASWNDFAGQAFPVKKRRRYTLRHLAAACFIIAFSIAGILTFTDITGKDSSLAYTIIENPTSLMKSIQLPDSSIVELGPDGRIKYRNDFTVNRAVNLEGTAFFRVKKDKQHPFRVLCGKTTTTVLGTSFNIEDTSKMVTVQLYEGKVEMSVANETRKWILAPGEQFIYSNKAATVSAFNRFRDFDREKMSSIIQYIKDNYGYQVEMPDDYLSKEITLRINRKEELSSIISIISQMCNLTPTVNDELKKISFN